MGTESASMCVDGKGREPCAATASGLGGERDRCQGPGKADRTGLRGVGFCCLGRGYCWVARCSLFYLSPVATMRAFHIMQGSEFCSELPVILWKLCPWTKTTLGVGVRCQLCWAQKGSRKSYVDEHKCLAGGLDMPPPHTSKLWPVMGVFFGEDF